MSLAECESSTELAKGSTSLALITCMQLHIFGAVSEDNLLWSRHLEHFCERDFRQGELFNSVASEPVLGSPLGEVCRSSYAELSARW
ncbi:MAG: hypothetical protein R2865_01940 [Deinococcales bacterium]